MDETRIRRQVCLPPAMVAAVAAHRDRLRIECHPRPVSESAALADLVARGLRTLDEARR